MIQQGFDWIPIEFAVVAEGDVSVAVFGERVKAAFLHRLEKDEVLAVLVPLSLELHVKQTNNRSIISK